MIRRDLIKGCLLVLFTAFVSDAGIAANRPVVCGTERWQPVIRESASRFEVPQAWLDAVMLAESAGCATLNGRPIVSSAGAMGLMQLMPATWREYQRRLGLGQDPYRAVNNIFAGAAYLHGLALRFGEAGSFAAYQAGPGRYEEFIRDGRPLPPATIVYVARVEHLLRSIDARSRVAHPSGTFAHSALFVPLTSNPSIGDTSKHRHIGGGLFVPLSHDRRSIPVHR